MRTTTTLFLAILAASFAAGSAWAAQTTREGGTDKPGIRGKERTGIDTRAVLKQVEAMCSAHGEMRDVQGPVAKQMQGMAVQKEEIPLLVAEASDSSKDWKYRFFVLRKLADAKDDRIAAMAMTALDDEK